MIDIQVKIVTHMGRVCAKLHMPPVKAKHTNAEELCVAKKVTAGIMEVLNGISEKRIEVKRDDLNAGRDMPPEGFVPEGPG